MEICSLKNISFRYQKNMVLENVSLKLHLGNFIAIAGENGAGKSTLLNIISGMLSPTSGTVFYKSMPLTTRKSKEWMRREKLGIIPQDYSLLYDMRVAENIGLPLKAQKISNKVVKETVKNLMSEMGILHIAQKYPDSLSGGESQKVAIARALIKSPELLLADEPTASLDIESKKEILSIFKRMICNEMCILVVTHEKEILDMADKVYYIQDGNLLNINERTTDSS